MGLFGKKDTPAWFLNKKNPDQHLARVSLNRENSRQRDEGITMQAIPVLGQSPIKG
jgi:hypothetical protein